jgi:hypothetical protein
MRAHLAILQPLPLTLLVLACATAPRRAETTPHALWDPITRAELAGTAIGDAYEAVQSLRPRWLRCASLQRDPPERESGAVI